MGWSVITVIIKLFGVVSYCHNYNETISGEGGWGSVIAVIMRPFGLVSYCRNNEAIGVVRYCRSNEAVWGGQLLP